MEQEHAQTALGTPSRELRTGFTLIELLVVIAIISLLVSILVPSLTKAKELAQRIQCLSNQRSLSIQVVFFCNENDDVLPKAEGAVGMPWWWYYLGEEEYRVSTWPKLFEDTPQRTENWKLATCPAVGLAYNDSNRTFGGSPDIHRAMDIGYNWWLGHPGTTWAAYGTVRLDQVKQPQDTVMMGDTFTVTGPSDSSDGIMEYGDWPEYRHSGACNFIFVAGQGESLGGEAEIEPDYFNGSIFTYPMALPFEPW